MISFRFPHLSQCLKNKKMNIKHKKFKTILKVRIIRNESSRTYSETILYLIFLTDFITQQNSLYEFLCLRCVYLNTYKHNHHAHAQNVHVLHSKKVNLTSIDGRRFCSTYTWNENRQDEQF